MPHANPPPEDTIEVDLNQFEQDLRKLKIEYEQYFGGGKSRPPTDVEWRMDLMLKRYGDRGAKMNYTQRFRFGNLAQTYTKFKEVFHKRLRKREEGRVDRHFGAAARAIETERKRARGAKPAPAFAVSLADPERETKKVEQLYAAFREALQRAGQPTEALSREQFQEFLKKKTVELHKQNERREIEFVVSVEGGKARLKARVRG